MNPFLTTRYTVPPTKLISVNDTDMTIITEIEEEEEEEEEEYDKENEDIYDIDSPQTYSSHHSNSDIEYKREIDDIEYQDTDTKKVQFIPQKVFIVPYRNRPQHKFFFSKHMTFILEDDTDYEIFFSHQCDGRTFNRGATKNIGFMAVKDKYPQHYKNMTFVFNDVDTIPFHKIFDYDTTFGIVKHYYGYDYALGGIVVMKGADFERINGFPCYWGWGMEDNTLQKRCERYGLKIDRSKFYKIGSPEILQLFDGISRIISKKDPFRMKNDNGIDGIKTIKNLKYTIDTVSVNPVDNLYTVQENENIYFINIKTFLTYERFEDNKYYTYDLRQPPREIIHPKKLNETKTSVITTDDWSNIPYYPTTKENRENIAKVLIASGKKLPNTLVQQIETDRYRELETDVYNSTSLSGAGASTATTHHHAQYQNHPKYHQILQKNGPSQISSIIGASSNSPPLPLSPYSSHPQFSYQPIPQPQAVPLSQNISHTLQQQILQQQILSKRLHSAQMAGNKYSPYYAKAIGARDRANKSANIGLGGIIRR